MNLAPKSYTDPFGRYYTSACVSDILVASLSIKNPQFILDLGSGDGSLSKAAGKRWSRAKYITVDIKKNTCLKKKCNAKSSFDHKHYLADALDPLLIDNIGLTPETVDLAICNPPFIKYEWTDTHKDFLINAGYLANYKAVDKISAEVIFIIQNLVSLKRGGQLGLIIPDSFVSGERNKGFREYILKSNSIDKVIKLPRNAFKGINIQSHIMIITKGNCRNSITLVELETINDKSKEIVISKKQAIESLNYSYHKQNSIIPSETTTLKNIGASVTRGKYNSKQCKDLSMKVFHTTDFKSNSYYFDITPFNSYLEKDIHSEAEEGDILLARVGRNITKKICIVTNGKALISDCVYRLRIPVEWRNRVFKYLISDDGKTALNSRVHGTGAMYLSMQMLMELPIPHDEGLDK